MLDTSDARLRADVAELLERLTVSQAAPLLSARDASNDALTTAISNYKRGTPPFETDAAGQVQLWKWNDTTKKLASIRVPADEAQIMWIARLADELARSRPTHPVHQLQALVLRLESAGLASGKSITNSVDPAALARADSQVLSAKHWKQVFRTLPSLLWKPWHGSAIPAFCWRPAANRRRWSPRLKAPVAASASPLFTPS
jgi:hypothetical protein